MSQRMVVKPDWLPDAINAIHITLTAVMAGLAGVLAFEPHLFSTGPIFSVMASWGSETRWACGFWAVACVGAVGVAPVGRILRFVSTFTLATAHGFLGLIYLFAQTIGTGAITYMSLAMLGYYTLFRRAHGYD